MARIISHFLSLHLEKYKKGESRMIRRDSKNIVFELCRMILDIFNDIYLNNEYTLVDYCMASYPANGRPNPDVF